MKPTQFKNYFVANKEDGGITRVEIPPGAQQRERETHLGFRRRVGIFHPLNLKTDDLSQIDFPAGSERAGNETYGAFCRRVAAA